MRDIFNGTITDSSIDDLVGCLPTDIGLDEVTFIRNINDPMAFTELNLIFHKISILKNKYYDGYTLKSGIDKMEYRKRLILVRDQIGTLHDKLEEKLKNGTL